MAANAAQAAPAAALVPNVPISLPVNFKTPEHPFLILNKEEILQVRKKIATEPWAKQNAESILQVADGIIKDPQLFPDKEAGWIAWYVCPKSGDELLFDPKSPTKHLCLTDNQSYGGELNDSAWRMESMLLTASQQRYLAIAYLVSGDKKYAQAMASVFRDIAQKYAKYQLHSRSMKLGLPQGPDPIAWSGGRATSQWIDESNLLTALVPSYDVLLGSGVLSPTDKEFIQTNLWSHAIDYMHDVMSRRLGGGNWDVWADSGAVVLGVMFGDKALVDQGLNSQRGVVTMLRAGYLNADGFISEHSPGYQNYAGMAFVRLASAARRAGIDFYKIPRFEKMFDPLIAIRLPNMRLPRLGDGRQASLFSYTSNTPPEYHFNALDRWPGMFETAWNWYRNPAYVEALADIYGADEAHGIKRIDVPEALLYGPDRLPENPPRLSTSSFLPDTLLAVLRTPQADWNAVLLCDKGGVIGHRHPAALGFQLFANGEEAFPGTGTPLYSHPTYTKWYAQTISHSTVALNTRSQIAPTTNQRMDFALSQWGVSAVEMSVEGVQRPNVTDECPARLRRTLAMTPRGIVDIFRVEKDEARLKNVKDPLPVNLLDWFLQIDGTLTLDNALAPSTDALIPKERAATPFGYDYLHDLQSVTGPGVVHGQLAQPKGGRVDLWLAPSSPDGKVYVAKRPGHDDSLDKELTALIQRRSANETAFAGFYAPCKDQAQVQSVRFPELSEDGGEVAMEISHKDGQDLVLSRAQPGTLAAEGATLDGTLGCEITLPGADRQFILVGTAWKHGETELSLKEAGSVIVDLSAGKTRIYNASDKPVEGSFRTSASAPAKTFSLQGGGKQD